MSLFDTLFNEHAVPAMTELFGDSVIAWEAGDQRVIAIQISTGRSFEDVAFHEFSSEKQTENGISNCIRGRLWLPVTAKVKQLEQLQLIRTENKRIEVTISSFGQRSGGFVEVIVEQLTITRFGAASFGSK